MDACRFYYVTMNVLTISLSKGGSELYSYLQLIPYYLDQTFIDISNSFLRWSGSSHQMYILST